MHRQPCPPPAIVATYAKSILPVLLILIGCRTVDRPYGISQLAPDRAISGSSGYPLAASVDKVGNYPVETKSGAGIFYDDVLEYRVWLHPECGAERKNGDNDYFVAFAQFERAEGFSKAKKGAEEPLALVRQLEWIDEPQPNHYEAKKLERIAEWQVEWLTGSKRAPDSIAQFLKSPTKFNSDRSSQTAYPQQ